MFTWAQFRLNIFVVVASLAIWSCSSNVAEDGPTDYIAELSSEDIIRIQKDNHWVLLMIDLRIADECRANLIEYVSSNYFGYSRMSPGDRAVWREIAQNSDEEERADIIKASVEGALSGLGRSILSAASVA